MPLSMRLFQNGSCWGFADFVIPILSQTIVAPALIRFLKSLISFKVILDIALLTSSISCFSWNASAYLSDGIGSFLGFFSGILSAAFQEFCYITPTLTLTLNHTSVLNITTSSSYNLLKQYIISRLCHSLVLCCVKFSYFNFDTVHMGSLICLFRLSTSTLDSLPVFKILLTWHASCSSSSSNSLSSSGTDAFSFYNQNLVLPLLANNII